MLKKYLNESAGVLNKMANEFDQDMMNLAVQISAKAINDNNALLICGNGTSASDAMHITGELVGRFLFVSIER